MSDPKELINRSNSVSTDHQIGKDDYPSRDKRQAVAVSMPTRVVVVTSPTHNRDNKSPPRNSRSKPTQQSVQVVSDLQKDQKEEDTVTYKAGILVDERHLVQDEDAGGGVPRRGDSLRNSPASSREGREQSLDRREKKLKVSHSSSA